MLYNFLGPRDKAIGTVDKNTFIMEDTSPWAEEVKNK